MLAPETIHVHGRAWKTSCRQASPPQQLPNLGLLTVGGASLPEWACLLNLLTQTCPQTYPEVHCINMLDIPQSNELDMES